MSYYRFWAPYKPVAQRRSEGLAAAKRKLKKGESLSPVTIKTREIAKTFWGIGWCSHFERMGDFANRLPRGRTYARNGSIVDLRISQGSIQAQVCGSSLYQIKIEISKLSPARWKEICRECSASVGSLIDLMQGKLSHDVIQKLTDPVNGMFPKSREIKTSCSCPDSASLCKHLAAVFYAVGNRFDQSPELIFELRGVDQSQLVSESLGADRVSESIGLNAASSLEITDLEDLFGIEIKNASQPISGSTTREGTLKKRVATNSSSRNKVAAKRSTVTVDKPNQTKRSRPKKEKTIKMALTETQVEVTESSARKRSTAKTKAMTKQSKSAVVTDPSAKQEVLPLKKWVSEFEKRLAAKKKTAK
jgi:uncharacterized Zn finger protein